MFENKVVDEGSGRKRERLVEETDRSVVQVRYMVRTEHSSIVMNLWIIDFVAMKLEQGTGGG